MVGFNHKALFRKPLVSHRVHSADAWERSKTNPWLCHTPDSMTQK